MSAVVAPAVNPIFRQPATDIFDPRHYAGVRKPLAEATTLSPWAYTSSRALLTGDTGFPHIPTLEGNAAKGSYYRLIFPSTMFGSTLDCMWWLELQPLSASRTKLVVGSCFPETVTARADFEEVVQRYYRRWDISIPEDNEISALQQIGLSSPFSRPGRLSHAEPLVHVFNNWVLDRVLSAPSATR